MFVCWIVNLGERQNLCYWVNMIWQITKTIGPFKWTFPNGFHIRNSNVLPNIMTLHSSGWPSESHSIDSIVQLVCQKVMKLERAMQSPLAGVEQTIADRVARYWWKSFWNCSPKMNAMPLIWMRPEQHNYVMAFCRRNNFALVRTQKRRTRARYFRLSFVFSFVFDWLTVFLLLNL